MTFLEDLKATAGQVLKKVGDTVGEVKDRVGLEYQIHQVRTQIKDAEDSAKAAHEAMGKRVYELFKAGQITDKQLQNGSEEVEALARKIEDLNSTIMKLKEDFERESGGRSASDAPASEAPPPPPADSTPGGEPKP